MARKCPDAPESVPKCAGTGAQVRRNRCPGAPESVPRCAGIGAQVSPESVPRSVRNRCPDQPGIRTTTRSRCSAASSSPPRPPRSPRRNPPQTPPSGPRLGTVWAHSEAQKRLRPRRYPYEAEFEWRKGGSNSSGAAIFTRWIARSWPPKPRDEFGFPSSALGGGHEGRGGWVRSWAHGVSTGWEGRSGRSWHGARREMASSCVGLRARPGGSGCSGGGRQTMPGDRLAWASSENPQLEAGRGWDGPELDGVEGHAARGAGARPRLVDPFCIDALAEPCALPLLELVLDESWVAPRESVLGLLPMSWRRAVIHLMTPDRRV